LLETAEQNDLALVENASHPPKPDARARHQLSVVIEEFDNFEPNEQDKRQPWDNSS